VSVFATLVVVYVATLAPGVTLWDSGEFLAAIHSLGIPHPPGTPVYVLIANVWAQLLAPLIGFAYSVNLLSAVSTALACALLGNLFARWTRDRLAAYAGGVCAGVMSSVWLSATETEVYSAALLCACLLLWIGNRVGETGERRLLVLGAYVAGLGWALHLMALLALPAAFYLAMNGRIPAMNAGFRRQLSRTAPPIILAFALGASAVLFMLVRARADPTINQGNPATLQALFDVLARRQYAPAPLWPRQAQWFIQIGNLFEYADWQVALGLSPGPGPSWLRTPITACYGLLGAVGFLYHRDSDRRSWKAMLILFVTATVGVIAYLNLKAGPSYGAGFVPADAVHEARERDYFFALAFVCWGLWAGFGAVRGARVLAVGSARGSTNVWIPTAGAVLSMAPIALNWTAVDRRVEPAATEARRGALRILTTAPRRAIVLARGDNQTYPVWYLQQVEGLRRDVTIVVVPLLPATWYRAELARRDSLLSTPLIQHWAGTDRVLAAICENAARQRRAIGTAPTLPGDTFNPACLTR
jgi:hypothetical protein